MNIWSAIAVVLVSYIAFAFIYNFIKMRHEQKMAILKLEELKLTLNNSKQKSTKTKEKRV